MKSARLTTRLLKTFPSSNLTKFAVLHMNKLTQPPANDSELLLWWTQTFLSHSVLGARCYDPHTWAPISNNFFLDISIGSANWKSEGIGSCLYSYLELVVFLDWRLCVSQSVLSDFLQPHGPYLFSLLWPMEFSRQEYWCEKPLPSAEDLPDPGTEPKFPTL